jgi:hypothetical protein
MRRRASNTCAANNTCQIATIHRSSTLDIGEDSGRCFWQDDGTTDQRRKKCLSRLTDIGEDGRDGRDKGEGRANIRDGTCVGHALFALGTIILERPSTATDRHQQRSTAKVLGSPSFVECRVTMKRRHAHADRAQKRLERCEINVNGRAPFLQTAGSGEDVGFEVCRHRGLG